MTWECRTCWGTTAVVDYSQNGDKTLCLDCDWDSVVGAVRDGLFIPQCVASTSGGWGTPGGRRCTRDAVLGGYCWQHSDKSYAYEQVYRHLRAGHTEDMAEAYRQVFIRAVIDAGLLQRQRRQEQIDQDRVDELMAEAVEIRRADEARKAKSIVYFVRREGLIKIGTTSHLANRLKAMSRGGQMPPGMTVGPVELLATTPGGRDVEARLHRQFDADRIHGTEWFQTTPRLLRLIARYQRRSQESEVAA